MIALDNAQLTEPTGQSHFTFLSYNNNDGIGNMFRPVMEPLRGLEFRGD